MDDQTTNLTGQLLIAMPTMLDPNFYQTVTYVCEHSEQGALGIVINRPLDMDLAEVFEQLSLGKPDARFADCPVLRGGPVQVERGFVLHESDRNFDSTVNVANSIHVTTSQDILSSIAAGSGPERALVALGYAGWNAGQLESEITANAWLNAPASPQIIFDTPFEQRWHEATALLGIDVVNLSSEAGHA